MTRTVLASVALLLLAAPAAEARRCSQLRGRDLAPAKAVRLVQRPNAEQGNDLLGCALPHGRVRRLASSADHDTNVESFRIRQVAGEKLLLDTSERSQYGDQHSTGVIDIRSGRAYTIVFDCY